MTQGIQPSQPQQVSTAITEMTSQLMAYLNSLGLPADDVLVDLDERRNVLNNMPAIVSRLAPPQRQAAMYISKFVAACVAGLFDAALNYMWDETIRSLRIKVASFDLEYFYDSVLTDQGHRAKFRDEGDLDKLDDWVLIKGCRETGIITDIGFKHLDYIRDMRNYASAAHPNQNQISGLQLVGWLETCIKEVLAKEPEGPAIEVRKLLRSLRSEPLSQVDVEPIATAVLLLPEDLCRSLLRAVFGMYTDPRLSVDVRNNIRLIVDAVWRASSDEARHEIGIKEASFRANGEVSRATLGREFLEVANGVSYLPLDVLAVEINAALDALMTTHDAFYNFHNEPPAAQAVLRLVPANGEVPASVLAKYVKVVTLCRIGNRYGVAWSAESVYDSLIAGWRDKHVSIFVSLVRDAEVTSQLQFGRCAGNYQALGTRLMEYTISPKLKRVLEFLAGFPTSALSQVAQDSRFGDMISTARSAPRR